MVKIVLNYYRSSFKPVWSTYLNNLAYANIIFRERVKSMTDTDLYSTVQYNSGHRVSCKLQETSFHARTRQLCGTITETYCKNSSFIILPHLSPHNVLVALFHD